MNTRSKAIAENFRVRSSELGQPTTAEGSRRHRKAALRQIGRRGLNDGVEEEFWGAKTCAQMRNSNDEVAKCAPHPLFTYSLGLMIQTWTRSRSSMI